MILHIDYNKMANMLKGYIRDIEIQHETNFT